MVKILVTGATGFVGRRLLERLERPVVLSRDAKRAALRLANRETQVWPWDPLQELPPAEAFADVEAVIHLAGEPIAEGRWTESKKARIQDSRIVGTKHLVQALRALPQPPRTLISASAVGYYGDCGDELLREGAKPAEGFLAQTCVAWERESQQAASGGIRVVNPRIGIVLGLEGGALSKMAMPFRLGLGAPLGSGKQWMPWIHVDDLVSLLLFAVENDGISGPMNATAPFPVTNLEFTRALGRAVRRPTVLPSVPGMLLKLGVGEMADVLLASQRVVPQVAEQSGFEFRYKTIDAAFAQIFA